MDRSMKAHALQATMELDYQGYFYQRYGPGVKITRAGNVAYVTKCHQVAVRPYPQLHCSQEIPVRYKNQLYYVDPIFRTLKKRGTFVDCDSEKPIRFLVDGEWFCLSPHISRCGAPQQLVPKALTLPVSGVTPSSGLGSSLYTHQQLEMHQKFLRSRFPRRTSEVESETAETNTEENLEEEEEESTEPLELDLTTLPSVEDYEEPFPTGNENETEALLPEIFPSSVPPPDATTPVPPLELPICRPWSHVLAKVSYFAFWFGIVMVVLVVQLCTEWVSRYYVLMTRLGCGWHLFAVFNSVWFNTLLVRSLRGPARSQSVLPLASLPSKTAVHRPLLPAQDEEASVGL